MLKENIYIIFSCIKLFCNKKTNKNLHILIDLRREIILFKKIKFSTIDSNKRILNKLK